MQGLSPRGGRSGSRLGFASRATPCTASAFVLILRTHTRCKSRNPYKARRTAAEFARWSAWSCPRRMSASISRSRSSMPRNRNPLRRRSRCRSIRAADAERDSPFVAGHISAVPRSLTIDAPGCVGEFGSSLRAEKYQNVRAVEIASYDPAPKSAIGPRSVAGRLTGPVGLPFRPGWKPVSNARSPPHSVTDVCRVFFGPTERRG
jgi:hypothetical protein